MALIEISLALPWSFSKRKKKEKKYIYIYDNIDCRIYCRIIYGLRLPSSFWFFFYYFSFLLFILKKKKSYCSPSFKQLEFAEYINRTTYDCMKGHQ